jgi:hypothetical protein
MVDWQMVRDWEVCEAVSDLPDNSYDMVGRDFPLGGVEADFLQYRRENFLVEAGFFYSGNRAEKMLSAETAGGTLRGSEFTYRVFVENADDARPDYEPRLNGNYFFDSEASQGVVRNDLEDLMPSEKDFSDLSRIRCEK